MATKIADKFGAIDWRRPDSPAGGPILHNDSAAYAVCTLTDTIAAGDHWILIGLVTEGLRSKTVTPMIFSLRSFG